MHEPQTACWRRLSVSQSVEYVLDVIAEFLCFSILLTLVRFLHVPHDCVQLHTAQQHLTAIIAETWFWPLQRPGTTGVPRREAMGVQIPHGIFKNLLYCVCKICAPSPAVIFIKSKILYRKMLKIVHKFHILLQLLGDLLLWLCPWTTLGNFCPPEPLSLIHI